MEADTKGINTALKLHWEKLENLFLVHRAALEKVPSLIENYLMMQEIVNGEINSSLSVIRARELEAMLSETEEMIVELADHFSP
jgi:hypothetical protein